MDRPEDIHFKCDDCGAKYKTNPSRAGRVVSCKYCDAPIFVPTTSGSSSSDTSTRRDTAE